MDSSPIETLYNNIEIKPICSLSTCFIKSKNNNKIIKNINELVKENLIMPGIRSSIRKNLEDCLYKNEIEINPVMEFETEELIIDGVRRGLGIGYVVKPAVKYLVDANILEYIELEEELPKMEINLVYIDNYLTNIAKLFIDEEIKKDLEKE